MDNFFDFIKENPIVKKRIRVNELLFAEYQCPLKDTRYDIWSHHNYFIYVTSGKKKWFTREQECLVKPGDCLFVRKGAHSVYQYFDDDFCAVVLFVPDSFIRSVLVDNRIKTGNPEDFTGEDSLFTIKAGKELVGYFHSLLSYLHASDVPADSLMELKFRELLMITASRAGNKNLAGYFATLCNTSKPSIREVMEENFHYPRSRQIPNLGRSGVPTAGRTA